MTRYLFETIPWWNTAVTNASECIEKLLNKPGNAVLNFWHVYKLLLIYYLKLRVGEINLRALKVELFLALL
jgi:hypothetical protein